MTASASNRPVALVVDDEPDICELLAMTLDRMQIETDTCNDVSSARRMLEGRDYQLCLTDMRLPDGDGLDLVEWMQGKGMTTPVAVITAHGNVETAVRALKLGAFDFISKPLNLQALRKLVSTALKLPREDQISTEVTLLGESPAIDQLRKMIGQGRPKPGAGAYYRRVRHGQGTCRAHDSQPGRSRRRPVHTGELRRNSVRTHGERIFWSP